MTGWVKTALAALTLVVLIPAKPAATSDRITTSRQWTNTATSAPTRRVTGPPRNPANRSASVAKPPLTFDATCAPGTRAVIAAVGDLLFHDALQAQALQPGQSFRAFWSPVASVLASADLTYGNLESPIAAGVRIGGIAHPDPGRVLDRVVYGRRSTELVFNTHPSVAADLAASGFDVVSTANNHSADRGPLGIDRTLDALAAAKLAATGTRRKSETAATPSSAPWSARTTTANGITVAWLACTFDLNGIPDPNRQVLHCYRDLDTVQAELKSLAADPTVDAVVFTPHWGQEGAPAPQASDRGLARLAIEAGATAVVGTHPHVLQPWEKVLAADGREALIIYSTGNFISNQKSDDQRTGIIALLEVTRPTNGSRARLSAAGYIPTYVQTAGESGHRVMELSGANDSVRRLPPGNRVTLATYRDLPRACDPAQRQPLVVANAPQAPDIAPSALNETALHTLNTKRDEVPPDRFAPQPLVDPVRHLSLIPATHTQPQSLSSSRGRDSTPLPPRRPPSPLAQSAALPSVAPVTAATAEIAKPARPNNPHGPIAREADPRPPPRRPPSMRNEPLRVGRLRLEALTTDATPPHPVAPRLLA